MLDKIKNKLRKPINKASKEDSVDSRKGKNKRQVSTKHLTREDVYKKPPLAQLYDKMNPGDYTIRQDFYHSLFLFGFIFIIFACLITLGIANYVKTTNLRSAQLTIPAMMFVSGQESNVTGSLQDNGFVDIQFDENGNIIAYGTDSMVKQYKDSFYAKHIEPLAAKMEKDHTEIGIESISISDDARTMTIRTYRNLATLSTEMSAAVEDAEISKIIEEYAAWCGIRNAGEAMTVNFVNVMDLTDGANGTQYWSSTRPTGSQMVADLETEERKALSEAESESEGGDG